MICQLLLVVTASAIIILYTFVRYKFMYVIQKHVLACTFDLGSICCVDRKQTNFALVCVHLSIHGL